jgi:uncharacterized Zn finger protein
LKAIRDFESRLTRGRKYVRNGSVVDLARVAWIRWSSSLQGRFSKGAMERICDQTNGLFPRPSEIRLSCSCPGYALMCKHVAAVFYVVGAGLDDFCSVCGT